MANFVAAYALIFGPAMSPAREAVFTTWPPSSLASRIGSDASSPWMTP